MFRENLFFPGIEGRKKIKKQNFVSAGGINNTLYIYFHSTKTLHGGRRSKPGFGHRPVAPATAGRGGPTKHQHAGPPRERTGTFCVLLIKGEGRYHDTVDPNLVAFDFAGTQVAVRGAVLRVSVLCPDPAGGVPFLRKPRAELR